MGRQFRTININTMSTQSLTHAIKTNLINNVLTALTDNPIYLYYARPIAYQSASIPESVDDIETENTIKSNMMSLKKLYKSDLIPGISKVEWSSGITYDQYESAGSLVALNFYVVDDNKVFKCINNGGGSPSTVKPNEQADVLSDGYKWKLMFIIPSGLMRKFGTGNYLPVVEDELQMRSAIPGTLDRVDIIAGGSAYNTFYNNSVLSYVPIFMKGDGEENDSATVNIIPTLSEITEVTVVGGGEKYRIVSDRKVPVQIRQAEAERLHNFSEGTPFTYAYGLANISPGGTITNVEIVSGGDNYIEGIAKVVQSSAIAYAKTTAGVISEVEIEYAGIGFSYIDPIIVSTNGSGADIEVSISPYGGHGSDPVNELKASHLMINTRVIYGENDDFTVDNDIRRLGFITNVSEFGTDGSVIDAFSDTLSAMELISTEDDIDISLDESLFGATGGAHATIIDKLGDDIRVIRSPGISNSLDFILGERVYSPLGDSIINSIQKSEYVPYSGDILYINNIDAIERSPNQLESINFILTF